MRPSEEYDSYVDRPATLVFRTTHIDRAGETYSDRIVRGEIIVITPDDFALVLTEAGDHVLFPVDAMHKVDGGDGFVGGQNLTRDFHNAVEPVRLRQFNLAEVQRTLADAGLA